MELILGLAFIVFGSGTICYCRRSSDRARVQIATVVEDAKLRMDKDYCLFRIYELDADERRERRLLGTGGE